MTGIHPRHLLADVIEPALRCIDAYSDGAAMLVLGTAAQESRLGYYLHQLGGGPALGIFQMEPATARDIRDNFLRYKPQLMHRVSLLRHGTGLDNSDPWSAQLPANLLFAAAMCRIHYLRQPGSIPPDLDGQARYWKEHYNTPLGAGTVAEYMENWNHLIAPHL